MKVNIRKGDTLWYYSQLFQLPVQLIIDSNPGLNPVSISIGQEINIPGFILTDHRIEAGETLWNIARSRNMNVDALLLVNPTLNPENLSIGLIIQVPLRVSWLVVQGQREYNYSALMQDLNQLITIYPFLRRRNIGSSVM